MTSHTSHVDVETTPAPSMADHLPSGQEIKAYVTARYGDPAKHGWRVRRRHQFGYIAPELWYEATVDQLVTPETRWIDVGGGKAVFPHHEELSARMADRCQFLAGVDPSENIHHNRFVDEKNQCLIEDYRTDEPFDLATLRMVVEHIQEPTDAVGNLSRLIRPGGHVVVYTPNRWSLCSITASLTPHFVHQAAAQVLWRSNDEDVFPTVYKMNTREQLRHIFEEAGFEEVWFSVLPSCSIAQRSQLLHMMELLLWRTTEKLRIRYPETNLLGIYRRRS